MSFPAQLPAPGHRLGALPKGALVLAVALGLAPHARGAGGPPAEAVERAALAIDAEGAQAKVDWLADDAREGREAGTDANRAAGRFLADHFARLGLEPLGDPAADGIERFFQTFEANGRACRNVVAAFPGASAEAAPGAAAEHVVLGAHYDHVGHGGFGSLDLFGKGEGAIHNGADDNASGTAALMEVAEALARLGRAGVRPRRTVVLVLFDAEEMGLLGAHHYVRSPALPLEGCVAMVNLDMVGRSADGSVRLLGSTSGRGLTERVLAAAAAAGPVGAALPVRVEPYMVPNSDHAAFYDAGVPVAFLTTGLHEDYHRPGDDADKIDAETLARIARLTFVAACDLAGPAPRLAFHEVHQAPVGAQALTMLEGLTGSRLFGRAVETLYGEIDGAVVRRTSEGLAADFVYPGTPMAAAGVQTGDVLVEADGSGLDGALGRAALRFALRDGRAALQLARGGERVNVDVDRSRTAPQPAPPPPGRRVPRPSCSDGPARPLPPRPPTRTRS